MNLRKAGIRSRILLRRQKLKPSLRLAYDRAILDQFKLIPELDTFTHITVFKSVRGEPDLSDLENYLFSSRPDIKVYAPRILTNKQMSFFPFTPGTVFKQGPYQIPEPPADKPSLKDSTGKKNRVLFLVPGAVFDRKGNRLGYGGGYFDRYLSHWKESRFLCAGISYHFQFRVLPLPVHSGDHPVDLLITNRKIIRFKGVLNESS